MAFCFARTIAVRWLEPKGFAVDPLAGVVHGYLHGVTIVRCGIVPIRSIILYYTILYIQLMINGVHVDFLSNHLLLFT